ncbi:hypothetical protein [Streptomyces sp. NPDC059916]|uniref:hypothetical protein n=1 Tax=Streptomyces sp. NPDC059916 TaxID=3347001 RepID=UPI00367A7A07
MTIGEVDAAPKDPKCVRSNADRAPTGRTECDNVRIVKVHGWWCTTSRLLRRAGRNGRQLSAHRDTMDGRGQLFPP